MKRFAGFLPLVALNVVPFSLPAAQPAPAFDALKDSVAVFSFPAPAPLFYNGNRAPQSALSGEELFSSLHDSVPAINKTWPSYKGSKAFMYSKADNAGCNDGPGVITFYSQVCVNGSSDNGDDYKEEGDANGDGSVDGSINAEHIWPQGYFNSELPMLADLHNLSPTFVTPNSRRGNFRFARVSEAAYSTLSGSKLGREGFEPADAVKGNVARALFYFVVRYNDRNIRQGMDYDSFWTKNVQTLLEWNRQDPPDANERRRNGLVESFQGNRNPFIDDPELADRIGEAVFGAH